MSLSIVIPAAGMGRRMKSYGAKSLIELSQGQTVLSRQIDLLRRTFQGADIIVVVGFEAERVCRRVPTGVRVVWNELYYNTNVCRSLELGLLASPNDRVLLCYGDLVFNRAALDFPLHRSATVVDNKGQMKEFEVGCTTVGDRVTAFEYGLPQKWGQIAYLQKKELALFRKLVQQPERRRYFGYEVLNEVLDHGGKLAAIEPKGMEIIDIDTSKDIPVAAAIN